MIIKANSNRIINFGVVGENPYNIIEFDISKLLQNTEEQQNIGYLNAGFIYTDAWNIVFEQSGIFSLARIDTIKVDDEAGILKWEVTDNLTSVEGLNRCQIIYNTTINEKKVLRKSPIYYFSIGQSLIDDVRPPEIDDWVSNLTQAGLNLISILEGLGDISEDIADVQEAADGAKKINEAADKINRLEENVDASEAWAVGTKNGVPVTQEQAGFRNNSRYWAYEAEKFAQGTKNGEEIENNTTNAKYFAEEAKKAKEDAENFANGENLETDTISAKYFSEQAKKWATEQKENLAEGSAKYWAEESEKFAQGTLHGEEILGNTTNAKYFANEAEKAKEESEKWAVGAIKDLEDGSSKYWAEQSEKHSDTSKLWAIEDIEKNTEGSAKYWAEKAAEEKENAKAWAVGGTEETEENSAKYWAAQAKNVATGDITETLNALISDHNKEEDTHSNQFKPITDDIKEIKQNLEKAGTADTIVASTFTEETVSLKFWKGTREEYNEIITKDPNTFYIVSPVSTSF